jgi:hypothetical protein
MNALDRARNALGKLNSRIMRMQSGKRQRSQLAVAIAIMKAYALQKRIDKLAAASHPKVDLNQPPHYLLAA